MQYHGFDVYVFFLLEIRKKVFCFFFFLFCIFFFSVFFFFFFSFFFFFFFFCCFFFFFFFFVFLEVSHLLNCIEIIEKITSIKFDYSSVY